jgi:TetR/AcrR family transcriptional regulator, transcriptional repressor for nem operon
MAKAQFDREFVIDKTIELFWQHGYNGSSMLQVVKATGLKPGSIYLAFGNKEGLFREALEAYSKKSLEKMTYIMDNANSIGEGICNLFENLIEDSTKENYNSCLLMKAQLEFGSNDDKLENLTGGYLKDVELFFRLYLEKMFDVEISKTRALSIMLNIFGIRVYSYQKPTLKTMRDSLIQSLPWLPWQTT